MKWITLDDLSFERMACCWLITRFIDRDASILFAPPGQKAWRRPDVISFESGRRSDFAALVANYALTQDRALAAMAEAVGRRSESAAPFAPRGLETLMRGLEALFPGGRRLLRHAFMVCDAIYLGECERLGLAGWSTGETELPLTEMLAQDACGRLAEALSDAPGQCLRAMKPHA